MKKLFFFIIPFLFQSCKKDETKILIYEDCKVEYPIYANGEKELYNNHSVTNQWEFESAKRQFAICLCEKYISQPDSVIKNKILEIYHYEEKYFDIDSKKELSFEDILKNRYEVFDPKILID